MTASFSVKRNGRVYTPDFLVKIILNFGGYRGTKILQKHVMDNSCGDGAFLVEIVRRYCDAFHGGLKQELGKDLEAFIHGIEIDSEECEKTKRNLDAVAREFGIDSVNWDVRCADTLSCFSDYRSKMDFVFGNPPYVRIHNLAVANDVKKFSFSQKGMTDLFIAFFEIGFDMLSDNGRMALITPSSWLNSSSGENLRAYIRESGSLDGFMDLEHFQPFDAMTYTVVSRFVKKKRMRKIAYCTLSGKDEPKFVDDLFLDDLDIGKCFYLASRDELRELRKILENSMRTNIQVKNGFATLADKLFIRPIDCENKLELIKASTGKWKQCIFPYDSKGTPIPFEKLGMKSKKYFREHRDDFSSNGDGDWYLFGRSQGLKDVCKDKIAINSIVKDVDSIKLNFVPAGKGVYGGLYIIGMNSFEEIQDVVCCDDFIRYVKALKKYKSGGYYTFSSKDLQRYLNFKLGE